MTKDEALKLALEALEAHADIGIKSDKAITAIKEALAQPDEQLLIPNILSHYGLQAIDFVADFKEAMKQAEQERPAPCAKHCEATAFQITIKNLESQLAQTQEQGPVAWFSPSGNLYKTRFHAAANGEQVVTPLYTAPPQRTWVGLTDEQIQTVHDNVPDDYTEDSWVHSFARAIEAKLKQKNGYAEEKNT